MATDRFASIYTPLGDAFELRHMTGTESLSRLFEYEVELIGTNANIEESELLGQSVTVSVEVADRSKRYFNGFVAAFGYMGTDGRHARYRATLRPWLWFLTQATDCRIFQHISVPDLVKQLFREHGFSDFEAELSGTYPEREYVVQYRETTFNFISRLLEHEGIYYFFEHEDGRHKLILADSLVAHQARSGYEEIPYYPPGNSERRELENVEDWTARKQVRSGMFTFTDFDFTKPRADLTTRASKPGDYPHSDKEIYDYPGDYAAPNEGERYARVRMEELQGHEVEYIGHGNVRGVGAGTLFTLTGYPRDAYNCEYLVTSTHYTLDVPEFESGQSSHGWEPVRWDVRAVESKLPYVPPRVTAGPRISGPQTATVVGKQGEEIWCDQYGRVKVQFHWDRLGKRDENSSCWVRVAQLWAGTGWGGIHIPRIGQEVIIEFLEGDPDQPIITGRVYNQDCLPPYQLPANQTQSGIKSRSSKGATPENFNELRFEDKIGEEQMYVQAERDMDTWVKNDQTLSVDHNRTKKIKVDETTKIGGNRDEEVTGNETIRIEGTRTETVLQTETINLEQARVTTITLGDTLKIGQNYFLTVGGGSSVAVEGANDLQVAKGNSVQVDGADVLRVGKDQSITIQGARTQKMKSDHVNVATKLVVEAGSEITFRTGAASITLHSDGSIALRGTKISVTGGETVSIRAASDVLIKGSRNAQN